MTTITRQALTDVVDAEELCDDARMETFQRSRAWLFLALVQNDVIQLTPATVAQLRAMFPKRDWPQTRANIESLIGAS